MAFVQPTVGLRPLETFQQGFQKSISQCQHKRLKSNRDSVQKRILLPIHESFQSLIVDECIKFHKNGSVSQLTPYYY